MTSKTIKKPITQTEQAVRHTITASAVLCVFGIIAGIIYTVWAPTPTSKHTGVTVAICSAAGLGVCLALDQWLGVVKWVMVGLLIGWGVWELVVHRVQLGKAVLSPVGQPN